MLFRSLKSGGFTFIEVIIGIFLMSLVFLGIFGMVQLLVRMASDSKNKIAATGVANGEIEKIRNLAYSSVGMGGGYPSGVLVPQKTEVINGKTYTILTEVEYVVDDKDGLAAPEDECTNDYKRVIVSVLWPDPLSGSISVSTDIAPTTLSEECAEPGGILSVSVFNSSGQMIDSPSMNVMNPLTGEVLKSATPTSGSHYFSLPAGSYRVSASKSGYSSERTFSITEIAFPEKPNPTVIDNSVVEQSFKIDKTGSLSIQTLAPWVVSDFSDSFESAVKIEGLTDTVISDGKIVLDKVDELYKPVGDAVSIGIEPASLVRWNSFSWNNSKPANTDIKYQVLYFHDPDWILIPDTDLAGNAAGLSESPVDLSELNVSTYKDLKIKAVFTTNDANSTPELGDWAVSWRSSGGTPIPGVIFNLHGEKKIGKDSQEDPVYKYNEDQTSGVDGKKDLPDMEKDSYTFSIKTVGLTLISTEPAPQPITLSPETIRSVNLFVDPQNSLSITVKNSGTGDPIFSVPVHLSKDGYDATQYTDIKGQTIFAPITNGTYTINVIPEGYAPFSSSVSIPGDDTEIIQLDKIE